MFIFRDDWLDDLPPAWPARRSPDGVYRDEGGDDEFWHYLSAHEIEFLRLKVAPLLRFVPDVNMDEELSNLIIYEQAYLASARMITTTQELYKALTDMLG